MNMPENNPSKPRRRRHYLTSICELIKANEKYPYKYISNLKYSEKTYKAFRNAMQSRSAMSLDLFVHSLTFRAEMINSGFLSLTEQNNYLCAMALTRMMIDTFLIAWAGVICKDRDKFLYDFQNGKPINRLTDSEGNQLTQGFLVKNYAEVDPLVKEIYQNGNDYIHPSHVFQEESVNLTGGISLQSYQQHDAPEELKRLTVRHMVIANNALCDALLHLVRIKHGDEPEKSTTE